MREIIAFIQKEFRHIFRDLRTTLIVLVMPVVQIILFGFAISTDVSNAVVDVVGDACDPLARSVISRIEGNKYLAVGEIHGSFAPARDRIRKGKAAAALCFGTDFDGKAGSEGKACVRIVSDGSDPNTAQVVTSYIKGVLQSEELTLSESLAGKPKASMRPNVQLMYNPAMNSSYNFVPGVMGLILMLICSMMTAVSIVKEKETGTLELLLVSPVKPFWIILSKMIPYLALSLVFVGSSLGLGLLVSVISKTQQTAMLLCGMGLTMPTMMLSGIIFPCESMPVALQMLSDIIPAKWFIIMVKKIMIQGAGLEAVAKEFAVLTGMMVFLLVVSIKNFKTRL